MKSFVFNWLERERQREERGAHDCPPLCWAFFGWMIYRHTTMSSLYCIPFSQRGHYRNTGSCIVRAREKKVISLKPKLNWKWHIHCADAVKQEIELPWNQKKYTTELAERTCIKYRNLQIKKLSEDSSLEVIWDRWRSLFCWVELESSKYSAKFNVIFDAKPFFLANFCSFLFQLLNLNNFCYKSNPGPIIELRHITENCMVLPSKQLIFQ